MKSSGTRRLEGHASRVGHVGLQLRGAHLLEAHEAGEQAVDEVRGAGGGGSCATAEAARSATATGPARAATSWAGHHGIAEHAGGNEHSSSSNSTHNTS